MAIPTKSLELMMETWRDHSKTGFHVTFLVNPVDQEFFRACADGQRFTAVLVKLTDEDTPAPLPTKEDRTRLDEKRAARGASEAVQPAKEPATVDPKPRETPANTEVSEHKEPAKPHFPGGLCGLAVRWCSDPHFHHWLDSGQFLDEMEAAADDSVDPEDQAKAVILAVCGVASRKELDGSPVAEAVFRARFLEPYSEARKEDGVDEPGRPF